MATGQPPTLPKEVARAHAEEEIALITREERTHETLVGELKGLPAGRAVYAAYNGGSGGPSTVLFASSVDKALHAAQRHLAELAQAKREQEELLSRAARTSSS
eukprot:m.197295 g.197295  ORF g.197295 m.197295 type:complete len:103 (+) comp20102_c0_seq1:110-418(+)